MPASHEDNVIMKRVLISCAAASALFGLVSPMAIAEPASGTERVEPKVVIKDAAITSSVKARLAADHVGGFRHVRVDTDDHGIVTLKGRARTQNAADRAISIAKETDGVREVRSAIEIKYYP
jgi:osmotically-inducible protein OsmY